MKNLFGKIFFMMLMLVVTVVTSQDAGAAMAVNIVATDLYASGAAKFKAILNNDAAMLTRTSMRAQANVENNKGKYELLLDFNSATDSSFEHLLKKGEQMYVIGIGLGLQSTVGGQHTNKVVYTNDATEFAVANQADQLRSFYNAKMYLKTGTGDRTGAILTHDLEYNELGAFNGTEQYYPLLQGQLLTGDADNKIIIDLPEGTKDAIQGATKGDTKLVIFLHGILYSSDDMQIKGQCF